MEKVEITISGGVKFGKTTMAEIIYRHLNHAGLVVEVKDIDGSPYKRSPYPRLVKTLKSLSHSVEVVIKVEQGERK
jgi:deoxyadenosine/deoxycytidine kinase